MYSIRRRAPKAAARSRDGGVTLIEMMVVLVIIATVAAIIVPNVIGRPDEARAAAVSADLRTIAASLEMYRLDNRTYPTTEQGLAALTEAPVTSPIPTNWAEGGYLPNTPTDPWGNPFVYRAPGEGGAFDLMSLGADGKPGGEGMDGDLRHGAPGGAAGGTG